MLLCGLNWQSRLSNEDGTTDMGEDSNESIEKYLGRHTDSGNDAVMILTKGAKCSRQPEKHFRIQHNGKCDQPRG